MRNRLERRTKLEVALSAGLAYGAPPKLPTSAIQQLSVAQKTGANPGEATLAHRWISVRARFRGNPQLSLPPDSGHIPVLDPDAGPN